jgi:hypothetical protein
VRCRANRSECDRLKPRRRTSQRVASLVDSLVALTCDQLSFPSRWSRPAGRTSGAPRDRRFRYLHWNLRNRTGFQFLQPLAKGGLPTVAQIGGGSSTHARLQRWRAAVDKPSPEFRAKVGGPAGNRTRKPVRTADFKSAVFANFTTGPKTSSLLRLIMRARSASRFLQTGPRR